jgi:low temperature requirement protein LtrA
MVWAFRGVMRHNYANLVGWSAIAGVAWIAGALVDSTDLRLALWILAVLLDYGAPAARFWLPGRGGTPMSDWTLAPAHLAERCQLVIIIALGESILVTGATFSELHRDAATVAAFVAAFAGSAALWWLYFARHAGDSLARVARADDPVRLGRGGYAYAHAVAVAGIIVTAVGDELVLAHPTGHMTAATALTVLGGAGLFMAGIYAFVASTGGVDRQERAAAIACFVALAVLGAAASALTPLVLAILTAVLLFALVAYAAIHARPAAAAAA